MGDANEYDPGFAPGDLTDGRPKGQWKTRYEDSAARRGIVVEAVYLFLWYLAVPSALIYVYLNDFRWLVGSTSPETLKRYAYAWLGGSLGGLLFTTKWLYHSVAHGKWNQDRRLWRLFTPCVSAGLAFAVTALFDGNILGILNEQAIASPPAVLGLAFLTGYFSDSVVAKLAELGKNVFGS